MRNTSEATSLTALLQREQTLYERALESCVGEWIAIDDNKLYHSPDPDELESQLRADGIGFGETHVTFVSHRPPYRTR